MFIRESKIKKLVKKVLLKTYHYLENNNNIKFEENGESRFINLLFEYFSKSKEKKHIIFDIGANIGNYSQIIKNKAEKNSLNFELHLFEPTSSCFSIIQKKFTDDNIKLNNFGVSNSNSTSNIYYNQEKSGLASLYQRDLEFYNLDLNKSEKIELRTLKDYIIDNKIEHISFIKIDIEGHELSAFEGMGDFLNSNFIDFIQFEYGGANIDSHTNLLDFYQLFNRRGFKIAKITKNGPELRSYAPEYDNFAYSNYIAVSQRLTI